MLSERDYMRRSPREPLEPEIRALALAEKCIRLSERLARAQNALAALLSLPGVPRTPSQQHRAPMPMTMTVTR